MNIECNVPDGVSGAWSVEAFEVSEFDSNMTLVRGRPLEYVPAGEYKRLRRGSTIVMSNTPMEIRTNRKFIQAATGNVLINGLGLGMILSEILKKDSITQVTVIEASQDVINLVAPTYINDPRVTIIHADAFSWKPPKGVRYDVVYHDIWDFICADNLEEMKTLHRRYGRRCDWQASWSREICEYENKRSRSNHYF